MIDARGSVVQQLPLADGRRDRRASCRRPRRPTPVRPPRQHHPAAARLPAADRRALRSAAALATARHIKTSLYPICRFAKDSTLSMRSTYLFTSESVSEGHPDKVADQITDAIVDLFLSKDPEARVACETMTTTNRVVLAGEIRGQGIMDEAGNWAPGVRDEIEQAVRETSSSASAMSRTASTGRPARLRQPPPPPVGAYRAGRRRRRQQGRGRRRPGHHVRLRLRRDPRPDAGDALLQPQDPRARWPPTATRAPRRSSSPTPRARSPCASRTASRPRRPRSSSRPSTARATTRARRKPSSTPM